MNLNDLAAYVTKKEGMKRSTDIAQVKEILRITFTCLGDMKDTEIIKLINRYRRQ